MRLCLSFLPLLLLACSCVSAPPPVAQGFYPDLDDVVALVDEEGEAYCSGVTTRYGVLTAYHCVEEATEDVLVGLRSDYNELTNAWEVGYPAAVLRVSEEDDLALLDFRPLWFAEVARMQPPIGEPVTAVGHPGGLGYSAHRGIVASGVRYDSDRPQRWFQTDCGILPGMSGGPVFNDRGEVVGIVSFTLAGAMGLVPHPHLGGIVATEAVREFLEE